MSSRLPVLPEIDQLSPIRDALAGVRARHGDKPVHGVAPGIVAPDGDGWCRASELSLDTLLDAAEARWPGGPHVAAALAFKSYAYWTTLPAVIGFASARRVPRMDAANVLVRVHGVAPFVEIGLLRPDVTSLADDRALLAVLRRQLLDDHLGPLADELHRRTRLGRRTLLGSLASAVCYALLRASDVLPGPAAPTAAAILDALGLTDLVEFGPGADGRLRVQRRTCCLEFAATTPRVCDGCVLPRRVS